MKKPCSKFLHTFITLAVCAMMLGTMGCVTTNSRNDDGRPRIKSFRTSPSTVQPGGTVSLRWSTRDADEVEIIGIGEVALRGTIEVIPDQNTTYILRARNNAGVDTRSVVVRVLTEGNPPPGYAPSEEERTEPAPSAENQGDAPLISRFTTSPASITPGETATLRWNTQNADRVTIAGIGGVALSGTKQVAPTRQTTYTLRAQSNAGTVTQSVVVRVTPKKVKAVQIMPAPKQISPADGSVFNHYPRRMITRWEPVKGAASYTVHVQYGQTSGWERNVENLRVESGIKGTFYRFDFVGAQPGRWRVWAVNAKGESGYKSKWRYFNFTR